MAGSSSAASSSGDDEREPHEHESRPPGRSAPLDAPESNADASNVDAGEAPSETSAEDVRRRLLAPIGGLYALAQSVTGTERAARRLVERTYERAAGIVARRPDALPGPDRVVRTWAFELLVETARQAPGEGDRFAPRDATSHADADNADAGDPDSGNGATGSAKEHAAGRGSDRHFRQRAQERFLRRALPSAFAALTPAQRLLLTLRDVEGLDLAGAAEVTDRPEREARQQHARARADLREALRQTALPTERPLVEDDALSEERLTGALGRMAKHDLTAPPPALRPVARHALRHPPQAPPSSSSSPEAAPDRDPDDDAERERSPSRLLRALTAGALIVLAGGLGYLAIVFLGESGATDLATLSAQNASEMNVRLRTQRAGRAEQFVRDELGRRLRVPRIEGAQLRGVGVTEVASGERVPVFRFRDAASGRPVVAYAYEYALLNRAEGGLRLSGDLRRTLRKEGRVATQDVDGRRVLLWRHRDDIFAAVTDQADSLQQRIAF
jgi:DNA-directed RNA polymerase specialized sigma24 family protein